MVLLFNARYLERYNYLIRNIFRLIFIWSWLRKIQINISLRKIPFF